MSHVANILDTAARFVEQGWTQGVLAADERGEEVRPLDARARAWCAEGAIRRATLYGEGPIGGGFKHPPEARLAAEAFSALAACAKEEHARHTTFAAVADWNDHEEQTQANVAATLRRVAAKLREGGDR